MQKIIKTVILALCVILLISCSGKEIGSGELEVDLSIYSVQERREAFLEAVWGEIPSIGHFSETPFPNITFERTATRSFEDIFFFTLVIFEHHPYLINPEENMNVYIAPDVSFNLMGLPGHFDNLRRRLTDEGTHIITGLHNGIRFEIEFKEENDND